MKHYLTPASLMIAALLPMQAAAADCTLSYGVFETGVPHTDMETCPEGLGGDGAFCRLTLVAEVATVFVFAEETGCLLEARTFFEENFKITFE